ncbi:MAG: class I SAM-dependent methyltransferase [Haloarculaceae archaeon]
MFPGSRKSQSDNNYERFRTEESILTQTRIKRRGLLEPEERAIETYFTDTESQILDIGCGAGRVTSALAARGYDVTGVDISQPLLMQANSEHPDIEFVSSDVSDLPFDSDSYKYVIFAFNGLDYLSPMSRRREALREIRRVLSPSGTFVFSSHNQWYALPALLSDRGYVRDKYFRRKNDGRLFHPYKFERTSIGDLETYFTNPVRQRQELSRAGFDLVSIVGKWSFPLCLVETSPYYVARPS